MPSAARSAQKILCASFFLSAASSVEWPMMNSAVVMDSEPKHYLTACPLSFRRTRAACPELAERVAHFRPRQSGALQFFARDETDIAVRNRHGCRSTPL